jgi:hypothetical protein
LLHLLHKHITICSKSIHGKHRSVRPVICRIVTFFDSNKSTSSSQSEHFWGIARLDAVAFALPGITSDDAEVRACDRQYGTTVGRVWVELSLLWVHHDMAQEMKPEME